MKAWLKSLIYSDDIVGALTIFLVVLVLFFSFMTPHFFSMNNFYSIIGNIPAMAILCLGLTYVVLVGDLDLSLGSILGITAILAVFFFKVMGFPLWLNLLSCVFIGGLFGALNGIIVTKIGINSIITTLGTMALIRGLTYWIAMDVEAMQVGRITDPAFLNFGRYYFPEGSRLIPITLVYIVILYGLSYLFLNHTSFGRKIYAVGSNEATARLAGINVKRVKLVCYIIAGALSAFGGLVLVAQLGLGEAYTGQNMILEVVTAVVLGGVLLTGGKGRLMGVIIAVLILGVIRNGMVHLEQVTDISFYWREVAKGVILLLAIGLYSVRKSFNAKRLRTRQ